MPFPLADWPKYGLPSASCTGATYVLPDSVAARSIGTSVLPLVERLSTVTGWPPTPAPHCLINVFSSGLAAASL